MTVGRLVAGPPAMEAWGQHASSAAHKCHSVAGAGITHPALQGGAHPASTGRCSACSPCCMRRTWWRSQRRTCRSRRPCTLSVKGGGQEGPTRGDRWSFGRRPAGDGGMGSARPLGYPQNPLSRGRRHHPLCHTKPHSLRAGLARSEMPPPRYQVGREWQHSRGLKLTWGSCTGFSDASLARGAVNARDADVVEMGLGVDRTALAAACTLFTSLSHLADARIRARLVA